MYKIVTMKKEDVFETFQERLKRSIQALEISPTEFCRKNDIDRSTLTQLMHNKDLRVPRIDTLAKLSCALGVSSDWLIGISNEKGTMAEIMSESLRTIPSYDSASEYKEPLEQIAETGDIDTKIRHHLITVPEYLYLDKIIPQYYSNLRVNDREEFSKIIDRFIHVLRPNVPKMAFETIFSVQVLQKMVERRDRWRNISKEDIRDQLLHIADYYEEIYPQQQLYLYDEVDRLCAPMLIYGSKKVSLWVGSFHFVFNASNVVNAAHENLNAMIRIAKYLPHQSPDYIRSLVP